MRRPLTVLDDTGFLLREPDVFRPAPARGLVAPDGALLGLGKAKGGTVMGLERLERLRRVQPLRAPSG